jgi:hypothetical protein
MVKCYGNHIDEQTNALSPWPVIERMIATALDTAGKGAAPAYDFNQKMPRVHEPARRRKRSQPHGLVTTEGNTEQLNVQQKL